MGGSTCLSRRTMARVYGELIDMKLKAALLLAVALTLGPTWAMAQVAHLDEKDGESE